MSSTALPVARVTVERLVALPQVSVLAEAWHALWRRCPGLSAGLEPAEALASYAVAVKGKATPHLLVLTAEEQLIGIVPLVITRSTSGRRLHLLISETGETLDAMVEPGFEPAAAAATFEFLVNHTAEWDVCELDALKPGSVLLSPEVPLSWSDRLEPHDAKSASEPRYRRILRHDVSDLA